MPYKAGKKLHLFSLACLLFFTLSLQLLAWPQKVSSAASEAPQEVRVGYIFDGDYMYKTPEGEYRGYDVEYLYTLAQQANWQISFVDYKDSERSLAALRDNQIDLLIGMAKTSEREGKYLFSAKKMVTSYMTLMVRPDDERYTYGDTANFAGMVTAARRGAVVVDIYKAWCAKNNLTPQLLLCDGYEDALQALLDKRADAMVVGGVYAFDKTRTVAQFSPSDSFFMLAPARADLKRQLDGAMDKVLTQNPLYELELLNKYFAKVQGDVPLLTPAEKAYVAGHPKVKVALLENASPYSYVDAQGKLQGVVVEYYRNLAKLTGLTFTFVAYSDIRAAQVALQNKEADILALYTQDIFQAVKQGLLLSVPYGNADLAMVSHSNARNKQRFVISQRDADIVAAQGKRLQLPKAQILSTSRDCFQALRSGTADAVLCDMQVAMWFLNQERISDYAVVSLPGTSGQIYSAVSSSQPVLHNVLDKSILASRDLFDRLLVEQSLQQDSKFVTFFNRIPRLWAIIAAVLSFSALILVAVAAWIILRRRKAEAKLAVAEAETKRKEAAVKATEKANEAKFNFFSNLSHDMRTPLNGIIGFTNLAIQTQDATQAKNFLQKINISGQLMLDLVNDMLTISRLANGKLTLNVEPITLLQLIKNITVPIEVTAAQAGINFLVDTKEAEDCTILADKLNVQKIFLNLLSNAMKFTEAGKSVTFKVKAAKKDAKTLAACLEVQDEGTGISPEFLPHIFEAFAQETAQGVRGTKGTGLGLAIVRQLVELMHGTITVKSKIGEGTTFTVTLPFALTEQQVAAEDQAQQASWQEITTSLQGKKILVCEDNALNMEIVSHLLAAKGMQVVSAANGELGVNAFRQSGVYELAAILMDNRMPVMNGLEATRAIRALLRKDAGNVPIIALTADVFPEETKKFISAGMNCYLSKPLNPELLYRTLAQEIGKRPQ